MDLLVIPVGHAIGRLSKFVDHVDAEGGAMTVEESGELDQLFEQFLVVADLLVTYAKGVNGNPSMN